jgi:hypothetical protein
MCIIKQSHNGHQETLIKFLCRTGLPVSGHSTAALTREHDVWEQACLRTYSARSRVECLVLPRLRGGARYLTKSAPRFTPTRERRRERRAQRRSVSGDRWSASLGNAKHFVCVIFSGCSGR